MREFVRVVWMNDEEIEALIHYHHNVAHGSGAGEKDAHLNRAVDLEMIRNGMLAVIGSIRYVRARE